MKATFRFFSLAALITVGASFLTSGSAQAQDYRFGRSRGFAPSYRGFNDRGFNDYSRGFSRRGFRSGPIYHGPSIQYDRVYHPDRLHWTPRRGLHTHGHTHIVPRYVPGHFDTRHRGHIHANPRYHR